MLSCSLTRTYRAGNEAQVATKDKLSVSRLIMLLLACWWDCLMKYECNMRRGQGLYWNQSQKERGPKSMPCMHTYKHTHTDLRDQTCKGMCVFLAYEMCSVVTLVEGLDWEKRDAAIERVVNRQAEKKIVTLLPNVMQMTYKELRQRRMERVTTATNVAVATDVS